MSAYLSESTAQLRVAQHGMLDAPVQRMRHLRSRPIVLKSSLSRLRYRAVMKPEVDTYLGRPLIEPAYAGDVLSVCMTAYNEDVSAYHASLSALARAADHFVHAGEPKLAQMFQICIVVDGLDKMSSAFADYAQRLGIYQPALLDESADYHIFETTIDRRMLQYAPQDLPEYLASPTRDPSNVLRNLSDSNSRQHITLFIKRENRGKLDSHRCYFEVACRETRPAYFLQVDVGTMPDSDAVYAMWHRIAHSQRIAAVSARSHMPLPHHAADVLGAWQYGDIASERILLWPTEVLMGYMCVLSGQLCMTRSDAVWRTSDEMPLQGHANPSEGQHDMQVMRSYLRGLNQLGPFESNMFLAEDRILGLEIVFQPDSRWDLGYVPEANAEIDRCDTWSELLAQRRRWICSGIACRLWMFTRVGDYLRSSNRHLGQKLRILSASAFHLLYFVVQWLMPAFAAIIFAALHHGVATAALPGWVRTACHAAYIGVLGAQGAQLMLSAFCKLTARINRFLSASMVFQTCFVAVTSLLILFAGLETQARSETLYQVIAAAAAVLILAVWYAKELFAGLVKYLMLYWASRPAVAFLIITHSALNSHDTSWGTKGLNRPQYLDKSHGSNAKATGDRRIRFELFRWCAVAVMLAANLALFAYASKAGWTSSLEGVRIVLLLILAQIAAAFVARFVNVIGARTESSSAEVIGAPRCRTKA